MRTAVLLSGGVDSSVALALLRRSGEHELTAFYLKIWLEDELSFLGDCPWEDDLRYARACCQHLGVPLEVMPLQGEYLEQVVEPALAELRAGRTPSPDLLCNRRIKFGAFLDRVGAQFDSVASGHYARRIRGQQGWLLGRAADRVKDQTYFLARLRQDQLARGCFPLGDCTKLEVRRLAAEFGLATAARPDSQGICFLGKIRYRDFVRYHLGERLGEIRHARTGCLLGRHRGYWYYTIGQRFGLGLGGGPWYVVAKDTDTNTLRVVHRDELGEFSCTTLLVDDVHWICGPPRHHRLEVRLRHGPDLTACELHPDQGSRMRVLLARPDPGVAPGQYAVFYARQICLGSGLIVAALPDR